MLKFDLYTSTRLYSPQLQFFQNLMLNCNKSPYAATGYHGYKHVLYAINTLSYITDRENLYSLPGFKAMIPTFIATLIWHDCNYKYPEDDEANTQLALDSLNLKLDNCHLEFTDIDFQLVKYYIKQLEFPFSKDASEFEIQLLRDCDISMILYEDYFSEDGLLTRLITNEFSYMSHEQLRIKCNNFIENLSYYSTCLNSILERIGKDVMYRNIELVLENLNK